MGAVINIGAVIGPGTMIDMGAVLGGRATVGARCHIGANAVLAGVIEPASAKPVVVEDGVEKAEEFSDVSAEELTISGFDSSDEGICTVTVEFGGFETSFEVSVRKKVVVTRGDVDGNGSVNMKDLLLCRRLVAGDADESEIAVENTDLNGDGSINLKDILVLRKILAGEE